MEAGHRTGTTVNDVLVAALAGALSTYNLRHHGELVDIPTMIPVNVRPLDEPLPRELGNRFALVLFLLPSGLGTPFERLAETKRRMDAIKHSPEAVLTFGLIRGIGRTGKEIERFLVDFFANKATGVTTNVPGPREPRYVAGQRIRWTLGLGARSRGSRRSAPRSSATTATSTSASRSTSTSSRTPRSCWPTSATRSAALLQLAR